MGNVLYQVVRSLGECDRGLNSFAAIPLTAAVDMACFHLGLGSAQTDTLVRAGRSATLVVVEKIRHPFQDADGNSREITKLAK